MITRFPDPLTCSPVAGLLASVPESVQRIAPENAPRLTPLIEGVVLSILDSDNFVCKIDGNELSLSTRAIETLWCYAFASVVTYEEMFQGKAPQGIVWIQVSETLSLARACASWTVDALKVSKAPFPHFPSHFPVPDDAESYGVPGTLARELTFCAIAFLLLHELGHRDLRHTGGGLNIDAERDADYFAADWILDRAPSSSTCFKKRAMGMAIALLSLTAHGIATGDHDGVEHPRDFDRLINTLERHADRDHEVWAFQAALLCVHTQASGIYPPSVPVRDFWGLVQHYADVLSRR